MLPEGASITPSHSVFVLGCRKTVPSVSETENSSWKRLFKPRWNATYLAERTWLTGLGDYGAVQSRYFKIFFITNITVMMIRTNFKVCEYL